MERLVALFHHRWGAPVLGELDGTAGLKFVTLGRSLGISRGGLRQTLERLLAQGLVAKNPGYGHPLRPEYVLTEAGRRVAPLCAELVGRLRAETLDEVGLKKWSVPVLLALARGPRRFSRLRHSIPGITDRSLTLTLKELRTPGLVEREVLDEYPPTTRYRLGVRARPLVRTIQRLERGLA